MAPLQRPDAPLPDAQRDAEWIAAIQAGRLDVFREIFDVYAPRLQRFAQLWTTWDIAEDIVQDVMFDVWQRRTSLDAARGSLAGYLYAAVRKRAAQHVRHESVVERTERNESDDTPLAMGAGPATPDVYVAAGDIRGALMAALAPLPELQRAALLLRWVHDLPFARIAEILGISENAAKLQVSRGRQALYPILRRVLDE